MIGFDVNWWAILVATLINMVIGTLWYSPVLFGKPWMKLVGRKMEDMGNPNVAYSITTVSALVQTFILANIVRDMSITSPLQGALLGLLVWLAFAAATTISDTLFANRPWKLWVLNTGYYLAVLIINGALLAVWR